MTKTKRYTAGHCPKCGTKLVRVGGKVDHSRGKLIVEAGYYKCPRCPYRKSV